jgi:hypothetical protein
MSERIVVGYDATEGAKAALAESLRLAGALEAESARCARSSSA